MMRIQQIKFQMFDVQSSVEKKMSQFVVHAYKTCICASLGDLFPDVHPFSITVTTINIHIHLCHYDSDPAAKADTYH